VADLRSYGVETEISALLAPGFSTFLNIGWNKAEYTSYCADLDGAGASTTPAGGRSVCGPIQQVGANFLVPTDYSDLEPIRAPTWDVTAGFNKEFLFDAGSLNWNARVNYRSDMYVNLLNVKYSHRPSMTTVDTSLTWAPDKGSYSVTLWGNNLTNEIEILNYLPVSTVFAAINPTDPRTYGVTLNLDF
jgi:iron complex outermembrane recepter protein